MATNRKLAPGLKTRKNTEALLGTLIDSDIREAKDILCKVDSLFQLKEQSLFVEIAHNMILSTWSLLCMEQEERERKAKLETKNREVKARAQIKTKSKQLPTT